MSRKFKKDDNMLELIPSIVKGQDWVENDKGLVEVIIPRNGILDKIVRPFLKTPRIMIIDLEELGSCVWRAIDGKRTIEEIGIIVREQFGEDAEPLYERLSTYINILRNNNLIELEKTD